MANVLVVSEKPNVGRAVAKALRVKETGRHDGYIDGYSDFFGSTIWITWAVGHLVQMCSPDQYGSQYSKWRYEDLPILPAEFKHTVIPGMEKQFQIVAKLMNDVGVSDQDKTELSALPPNKKFLVPCPCVVCATDAGREGELIFRLLYQQAGCGSPVKRLWISSMEEAAIREGFGNLQPGSNYDSLYHAALCRQRADWLVGINGTRLFTVLYGGKVLKVGRVQTPTLAMLAERETQIREFKKEKYYTVHILADGIEAATGRIDDKNRAEEIAEACRDGQAFVKSVVKEEKAALPPKLYDLTTLQRDANRLFGYTAKQTLEYTQSLYEKKLATYPRTDSRFLSDDMEQTAEIVAEAVFNSHMFEFEKDMTFSPDIKRVLDSGKVTDHHAVIPTMEIEKADFAALPETERRILLLIAGRLLCAVGERHLFETVRAELSCNGHDFVVSGKSVLHNGWKFFEEAFNRSFQSAGNPEEENREEKLPELSDGQAFKVVQVKTSAHFTSTPKHFTEDSLLAAMERAGAQDMDNGVERKGLGTPATRADIIEKLVRDGFAKREKRQIIPTEDGLKLIAVLPDAVKSPKLTADWENSLALVAKGELSMEDFMAGIEKMVSDLVHNCHEVGSEQKKMFAGDREMLGTCPNCSGNVAKGKFGAYCMNKCGMNVSRVMGAALTDAQIKDMLVGKKILLKGLKSRTGRPYDAYIIPVGTEEYRYIKDGKEKSGVQYKFQMEFPEKKFPAKKK